MELKRQREIYDQHYHSLAVKTDKAFASLFVFQWILGIIFAVFISPKTWAGALSQTHVHVYAAIFLGFIASGFPIYLVWKNPGKELNRYVIAVSQIFYSILYIHLTGGRIETHFHIFGSLAFLAFYRDYRVLAIATLITTLDHVIRGYYWPESVYGVLASGSWRALEHAGWVIFEDIFLIMGIKDGRTSMRFLAWSQSELELTLENVEKMVEKRTQQLNQSHDTIMDQQKTLEATAKLSALGEMAAGIAHEINTPLSVLSMRAEQLQDYLDETTPHKAEIEKNIEIIHRTVTRISKIIDGLRFFSRSDSNATMENTSLASIIDETLEFCRGKFKSHGVDLQLEMPPSSSRYTVQCRPIEISQVILNLLNNAYDAIQGYEKKWIRVTVSENDHLVVIKVADCGLGIPEDVKKRLMEPFFTTKPVGKGTGLGLSISRRIMAAHEGRFYLDEDSVNTTFCLEIPKIQVNGLNKKEAV